MLTLQKYMFEMVQSRRYAEKAERYDLFSSLLEAANDDSDGEPKLSDAELVGTGCDPI